MMKNLLEKLRQPRPETAPPEEEAAAAVESGHDEEGEEIAPAPLQLVHSFAPHVLAAERTGGIMLDVLVALVPALAVSTYFFGPRVPILVGVSVVSAVVFELLYRLLLRKKQTAGDLSAAVTGVLLAMCLPVAAPYWVPVLGAGFAIVIVKQLYGGIGKNFLNPALAGYAFLLSFEGMMTRFAAPGIAYWVGLGDTAGAISTPAPLEALRNGMLPASLSLRQMLLGQHSGALGQTASFALILGGLYLIIRGVIRLRIPALFLGTVAALTYLFPRGNAPLDWMLFQLLSGGLLLGAFFMATDYATAPITPRGQTFYAIGCGLLTVFLRYYGARADGTAFAILAMNCCAWFFDQIGTWRRFGTHSRLTLYLRTKLRRGKEVDSHE